MSEIGFTEWASAKMDEFSEKIYEIEDGICSIEENEDAIIEYLKNIRYSNTIGLQLRRYMCEKFSQEFIEATGEYKFVLLSEKEITVKNLLTDDYDIAKDDVPEFIEIFLDINKRFNTDDNGNLVLNFPRSEAKRLLCADKKCLRSKLFLVSFALHMEVDDVNKVLTDTLAEQTYNFRNPEEVIAFFCQSHEEYNSYANFLKLKNQYDELAASMPPTEEKRTDYTKFASLEMNMFINTEGDLMNFLKNNISNFNSYSQTLYSEFERMIDALIYDGYCESEYTASLMSKELRKGFRKEASKPIKSKRGIENTEQLAREMLEFIPRSTSEKEKKDGTKVVTNDFIVINSIDNESDKKVKTTTLPKEITKNLLMKDRLDDLIRHIKPIERKDIVFLKFYLFSLELLEREYTSGDYMTFMEECNAMLERCGMSRLYLANRFENLIMLSLLSETPFDMFSDIIEYSFFNEPPATE